MNKYFNKMFFEPPMTAYSKNKFSKAKNQKNGIEILNYSQSGW